MQFFFTCLPWTWTMTLTHDLATWFLCTDTWKCLMKVNICLMLLKKFKLPKLRKGLSQVVLGQFITLCDLDIWVTDQHDTSSRCDTHLCQVISKVIYNWQSYGRDKLFDHIWPLNVTLTLVLATLSFAHYTWWWTLILCRLLLGM